MYSANTGGSLKQRLWKLLSKEIDCSLTVGFFTFLTKPPSQPPGLAAGFSERLYQTCMGMKAIIAWLNSCFFPAKGAYTNHCIFGGLMFAGRFWDPELGTGPEGVANPAAAILFTFRSIKSSRQSVVEGLHGFEQDSGTVVLSSQLHPMTWLYWCCLAAPHPSKHWPATKNKTRETIEERHSYFHFCFSGMASLPCRHCQNRTESCGWRQWMGRNR